MKLLIQTLAFVSLLLLAESSGAATFFGINMQSAARDNSASDPFSFQNFNKATIPPNSTLNVSAGGSHNNTSFSWTVTGGQTVYSLDLDHGRTGSLGSYVRTFSDSMAFKANANGPYTISGFYNVTDVGTPGYVFTHVRLIDFNSAMQEVFYNEQVSQSTSNEHFTLGDIGGDKSNILTGSLAGNLVAGHTYELSTEIRFDASPDADDGATALGNVTLKLGTVSIPGDFDNNGLVDAGDYVVWRHNNGPPSDYNLWRSRYAQPITGSGSSIESASVPEPSSLALLILCVVILLLV